MQRLMGKVMEETRSRESAVLARTTLEKEVDDLTSSLFKEANRMVASERVARAQAEQKSRQLEEHGEALARMLESVQETLKVKMESVDELERELASVRGDGSTAPTSDRPAAASEGDIVSADNRGESTTSLALQSASMHLPHGVTNVNGVPSLPAIVLLPHITPYHEFLTFISHLRKTRTSIISRPLTDGPNSTGFSSFAGGANPGSPGGLPANPAQQQALAIRLHQAATEQLLHAQLPLTQHTSQAFMKRCVEEDSDPGLRLDLAPGLGFLSRRTVANAILDGSLIIEPTFHGTALPAATCALCGVSLSRWADVSNVVEQSSTQMAASAAANQKAVRRMWSNLTGRASPAPAPGKPNLPPISTGATTPTTSNTPLHQQVHVFRTSENATTRYAVCPTYCLGRLRTACDLYTHVRALARGLLLDEAFRFVGRARGAFPSAPRVRPTGRSSTPGTSREDLAANGPSSASLGGSAPAPAPPQDRVTVSSDMGDGDLSAAPREDESLPQGEKAEVPPEDDGDIGAAASEEPSEDNDEKSAEDGKDEEVKSSQQPASATTAAPPPIPKRSGARPITPVVGSTANFSPAQPSSATLAPSAPSSVPASPAAQTTRLPSSSEHVPPPPPPRRDITPLAAPPRADDYGWEDRCWGEIVRLKESLFWARFGALQSSDGEPVTTRIGTMDV